MTPPLIETCRNDAPRRHFAGREVAPSRREDLAALAGALLSSSSGATGCLQPVPLPKPPSVCIVDPCGLDGLDRRQAAVAAAARLVTPDKPAACLVFENGRADAYPLGSAPSDETLTAADFIATCDQVVVVALDGTGGPGPAADRTVFLTGPDTEGLLETYRGLKSWRAAHPVSPAALFVVGAESAEEARRLHRRLAIVARQCMGFELGDAGFSPPSSAADATPILTDMPAADVLAMLPAGGTGCLQPVSSEKNTGGQAASATHPNRVAGATGRLSASATDETRPISGAEKQDEAEYRVFSPWVPESREALLAAIEVQGPALGGGAFQQIFRVEVDEPGAPPLAAVRTDGALVAILVARPGESVDAAAAGRWLAVHRRLLARAYPCSGIRADVEPSAIVLAPVDGPAMADGVRRFVAVRTGGHRGIVLLP
jgi:hypothetical protein